MNKIAQKVGEEAVEVVIEAKDDNEKLLIGTQQNGILIYDI